MKILQKHIQLINYINETDSTFEFVNSLDTISADKAKMLKMIANLKSNFEPGAEMRYSDTGYLLLAYILEQRCGIYGVKQNNRILFAHSGRIDGFLSWMILRSR